MRERKYRIFLFKGQLQDTVASKADFQSLERLKHLNLQGLSDKQLESYLFRKLDKGTNVSLTLIICAKEILNFLCLSVNGEASGILSLINKLPPVHHRYREEEGDDEEDHPPIVKARYWRELELRKKGNPTS